ncbi:MAG: hypothetical protein ACXV5S_05595 [Acidimicrobiales bacterium]
MFGPRSAVLGGIAGAVVGSLVAVALVMGGALDDRVPKVPAPDASAEFLAAYQRSLEGTYVVRADFTRRLDSGATLRSNALVAQRPPDSIRRQFGGISGTIGGHLVTCSTEDGGGFHCSPSADAPPYEETVQQSVQTMTSYFTETPALYRAVRYGADCFELIQNRPSAVLPYGSQARFCFDEATGAVKELIERLEGAIDTFEATDIRGSVTAGDFSLSEDDDFALHTEAAATDPNDITNPDDTTPTTGSTAPTGSGDGTDPTATSTTAPSGTTATTEAAAGAPASTPLPHTL